jgi:hypothetical protein
MSTCPDEGACKPAMILSRVDFPDPFLPVSPIRSWSFIRKEISVSRSKLPKETPIFFTETILSKTGTKIKKVSSAVI